MNNFFSEPTPFQAFNGEHKLLLILFVTGTIAILWFSKNKLADNQQKRIGFFLSLLPITAVLTRMIISIQTGTFSIQMDLPLYICRIVSIGLPFMMYFQNKKLFGILYFWILAGTFSAVLTPDLKNGFPHYDAILYWTNHLVLILTVLYAVFVYRMRPTLKDLWIAYLSANIYIVIIHLINIILDANYSYTMERPEAASVLDYFGAWPYYIFTTQLLALVLFVLLYLPFSRKKVKK